MTTKHMIATIEICVWKEKVRIDDLFYWGWYSADLEEKISCNADLESLCAKHLASGWKLKAELSFSNN